MRCRYLTLAALILATIPFASSGSVGISPAYYIEHFEPNLEKTYNFATFASGDSGGVSIILEGSLSEYANVSSNFLKTGGSIAVTLKLPENLSRPGKHEVQVKIYESKNQTQSLEGVAAIIAPIRILVPYPGQYTESELIINDINEGQDNIYNLNIQNLGTENITLDTILQIFKVNEDGEKVLQKTLNNLFIETKRALNIEDSIQTSDFEPGIYFAKAIISYGNTEVVNTTFRVGQFLVDIIDYDFIFETGKINEFNIQIANKWNTKIESVFGEVTITDKGKVLSTFRTISTDTDPWETKYIAGFFDAEGVEEGRYLANIRLHYGNETTHKLVAIYLQDPPKERGYMIYLFIGIGIISITAIIGLISLIKKINKLKVRIMMNEAPKYKKDKK